MEKYVLWISHDPRASGLGIVREDASQKMRQQLFPSPFYLENQGDFYTEVSPQDLARKVHELLSAPDYPLPIQPVLFDIWPDESVRQDREKLYVMNMRQNQTDYSEGVLLYHPKVHEEGKTNQMRTQVYILTMIPIIDQLFSTQKSGTLQQHLSRLLAQKFVE